jgi:hypothetical protein
MPHGWKRSRQSSEPGRCAASGRPPSCCQIAWKNLSAYRRRRRHALSRRGRGDAQRDGRAAAQRWVAVALRVARPCAEGRTGVQSTRRTEARAELASCDCELELPARDKAPPPRERNRIRSAPRRPATTTDSSAASCLPLFFFCLACAWIVGRRMDRRTGKGSVVQHYYTTRFETACKIPRAHQVLEWLVSKSRHFILVWLQREKGYSYKEILHFHGGRVQQLLKETTSFHGWCSSLRSKPAPWLVGRRPAMEEATRLLPHPYGQTKPEEY